MSRENPEPGRVAVAILARAPIPGQAKTRLIPVLGAEGAANLQRWLLQRTVALALAADLGPVSLWCAGDPRHPDFDHCCAFGAVTVRQQPEGDLGARMLAALRAAPTAATLVIGTDCPALTATHLHAAARALDGNDVVLLPAEDGGYVLVGATRPLPGIFAGVDWGSDQVMAQTRVRLRTAELRWSEPATLWDVDRPEDLARLAALYPEALAPKEVIPL